MEEQSVKWYYGVPAVLGALFLLGPFAFPLLWKSPAFNRFWKIILTSLITAATIAMLISTWQLVQIILREFSAFNVP
jgi:putative effector of murein hydrolase